MRQARAVLGLEGGCKDPGIDTILRQLFRGGMGVGICLAWGSKRNPVHLRKDPHFSEMRIGSEGRC